MKKAKKEPIGFTANSETWTHAPLREPELKSGALTDSAMLASRTEWKASDKRFIWITHSSLVEIYSF